MRERASAQNETLLQSEEQEYVFTNTAEHRADFVPHEQLDARATREIISEMLTELPVEQSRTLVYRFVEGLPIAEIAEIMDCTVSTVKSRLKYGKAKIEEQVTAMEKKGIKLYSTSIPMLLACLRGLLIAAIATGGAVAVPKLSAMIQARNETAQNEPAQAKSEAKQETPEAAPQTEKPTMTLEEQAALQTTYDCGTAYLKVISDLQAQLARMSYYAYIRIRHIRSMQMPI